jgi:hypothetical protein
MPEREYFESQPAAEQRLKDEGYTPPKTETGFWCSTDGLIDADVRQNEFGYFIVYRG